MGLGSAFSLGVPYMVAAWWWQGLESSKGATAWMTEMDSSLSGLAPGWHGWQSWRPAMWACTLAHTLSLLFLCIRFSLSLSQQPLHRVSIGFLLAWQSQYSRAFLQGGSGSPTACSRRPGWELRYFLWRPPQSGSIPCWLHKPAQMQCRAVWLIRRHLWRAATTVNNFTDEETDTLRGGNKGFELRVWFLGPGWTWENHCLSRYPVIWKWGNWRRGCWRYFHFSQALSLWI